MNELEQHMAQLAGAKVPAIERLRKEALVRFNDKGYPDLRDEDWKYTNVNPMVSKDFNLKVEEVSLKQEQLQAHLLTDLDAHRLVFVNGVFTPDLSQVSNASGLTLMSMAQALNEGNEVLLAHLGQYADQQAAGFVNANTAWMEDGIFVHVTEGQTKSIYALFLHVGEGKASYPRNLIVVENNSECTLIENHVGLDAGSYASTGIMEAVLEPNSVLRHFVVQQHSPKAYSVADHFIQQEAHSQYYTYNFQWGSRLARQDINVNLAGQGAHCSLDGLYMGRERQHLDTHSRIDHMVSHCTSHEDYKGILDDRSRAVFNGKVFVHPDAQKTDANQQNKNLLLSKQAEVDTKPQLEIYADDVKCAHGATVGQLDETSLFYLQSRGIDLTTAKDLLTFGFAHDVVNRVPCEELRTYLEKMLMEQLTHGDNIREFL